MKRQRFAMFILVFCLMTDQSKSQPETEPLYLSAIDWCPQICPKTPDRPGYLVEMVKDLFRDSPFKPEFEYVPWSRAIHHVRTGKTDGLLSPSKDEAPDLIFHESPLSYQTHCFWKLKDSAWDYTGAESLLNTRFVIYRDHSYSTILGEVFNKIEKDQYLEIIYDENYLNRAVLLLKAHRAETFLFTVNSVIYHQHSKNADELKIGQCIKKDELWLALSPKNDSRIKSVKAYLDENLSDYKRTDRYTEVLTKYHIIFPALME